MTLHADLAAAKDTISRLKTLEEDFGVQTVLAHDASWIVEGEDDVLLSLLDEHMSQARARIVRGEIP